MKKVYQKTEMEILGFDAEEIVRTSGNQRTGDDIGKDPFDDGWSSSAGETV